MRQHIPGGTRGTEIVPLVRFQLTGEPMTDGLRGDHERVQALACYERPGRPMRELVFFLGEFVRERFPEKSSQASWS